MKNLMKFLGIFLMSVFVLTSIYSCRDDDDPSDNDFFAGTYTGDITYNDGGSTTITKDNTGKVLVTKIASGTKYNFAFSDGIPDLNGVEFEQKGDNVLVSVGATSLNYIRIDDNKLTILYNDGNETWTANCTR